jgi:hypothetical protein
LGSKKCRPRVALLCGSPFHLLHHPSLVFVCENPFSNHSCPPDPSSGWIQNPSSRTIGLKQCSVTVETSGNGLRYRSRDEALAGHRSSEDGEDCCEHFPNTTPGFAIRAKGRRRDRRGHYPEHIMRVQRTTAYGGESEPGFMQVTTLCAWDDAGLAKSKIPHIGTAPYRSSIDPKEALPYDRL